MWLPAREDRGVIVFKVWPSLPYGTRLRASFGLIVLALAIQLVTRSFLHGCVFLAAGNLLLLVHGYDNRVDFGTFDPAAQWERVDLEKLDELERLDRKIRRWDASFLDVTNARGGVLFAALAGLLAWAAWGTRGLPRIVALDGMVLFLPHWITGIRSILLRPRLVIKARTLKALLTDARDALKDHDVNLMMLLRGRETRVPHDLKIRVDLEGGPEDFLGLYGQVVINEVKGSSYPYFYVVLVARRGFGLRRIYEDYRPPVEITKEFKRQDEVEVLVIRQTTTETSGYSTDRLAVKGILREGLHLAAKAATPA